MRPDNWRELKEDEIVEFDIHCKMNRAWANEFISFLAFMENCGELGCSRNIAMYADGDGDFRPKFSTEYKSIPKTPCQKADGTLIFDAG